MVCKNGHNWGPLLYSPEYERGNFCFSSPSKTDNWVRFCTECGYSNKIGVDKLGNSFVEDLPKMSWIKIDEILNSWDLYHEKSTRSYRILQYMDEMYERHYPIKGKKPPEAEEFPLEEGSEDKFPKVIMFGLYDYSGPFIYIDKNRISKELASYFTEYALTNFHYSNLEENKDENALLTMEALLSHIKSLYADKEIVYDKENDLWVVSR